jgi:spermidine synthase
VACADLVEWLGATSRRFRAICLDVDNGPGWTVADANSALYSEDGLARLRDRLEPGGAVTIWSAHQADGFDATLQGVFARVERFTVEVPRGEPDVVYAAWRD